MQLKLSRTAQNLLFWGAAAAIFTLLLIPGIHVRKKHWDEPHWVLSGQIGYQLLKHGDPDNPFWHRDNLFLLSNPWFSRLLVGFALDLTGYGNYQLPLWIPIAWNRYHLPIVPVFALLDALLVGQLAELLRRHSTRLWTGAALVLLGVLLLSWLLQLNKTANQTLPGALTMLRVLLVIAVCGAFWLDKTRARPVMVEGFSSAHSLG